MISEDSSIEFDLFEDSRRRLTEFLISEGCETLDAERVAFHVIQGVRGVPKLLAMLHQTDERAAERTRAALDTVLAGTPALDKARRILQGRFDPTD